MRWQEHRQKRQKDKTLYFQLSQVLTVMTYALQILPVPKWSAFGRIPQQRCGVKIHHIRRVLGGPCRYFYLFRKYLEEVEGIRFTEDRGYGKTKTQMKRG